MLLHVGYHKTDTTWLQRYIFSNTSGSFGVPCQGLDQVDQLIRPHPLEWDEVATADYFHPRVAEIESKGLVPVLSNEEFSGNPHSGSYQSLENARRLHRIFPEAKVLIVIRRQVDQILSSYKQYVSRGGALSPNRYFERPREYFRVPGFRFGHFEFDRLIRVYLDLFGKDRVMVLPYEWMVQDRDAFLGRIYAFSGSEPVAGVKDERERLSLSGSTVMLQRQLNRHFLRDDVNQSAPFSFPSMPYYLRRFDGFLSRIFGTRCDAILRKHVEDRCRGRYVQSNARTIEMTGLPLADLGYELP